MSEDYKALYEECKEEKEELEKVSEEVEEELEATIKETTDERDRITEDRNNLKAKLDDARKEGAKTEEKLQKKLAELQEKADTAQARLVKVELANDDMERNVRMMEMTAEQSQSRLDDATENEAFLQGEMEEKIEMINHLEGAMKDMQSEIEVLQTKGGVGGGVAARPPPQPVKAPDTRQEALQMMTLLLKRVQGLEAQLG